ncbi:CehA/McbA family metallohydrolase [Nonomuraea typhae]|uniref:CehA/McbA family metallohydrolase n=1 Tax=Nonomuraea typhae TaxID=2603600 RepID=UPI0012F87459|nr:CehA/McbA family metallohydrolase [Nonomuraea typhae]
MDLPRSVAHATDEIRALAAQYGVTWGEGPISYTVGVGVSAYTMNGHDFLTPAYRQLREKNPDATEAELGRLWTTVDPARALREALDGDVLENLAALRITGEGAWLDAVPRTVLPGGVLETTLLIDSSLGDPVEVIVGRTPYTIEPCGALLVPLSSDARVRAGGRAIDLAPLVRHGERAWLTVRAGFPARWSVTGGDGQGWWPEGVPRKVDFHRRPYFHGDEVTLEVPAGEVSVAVTRGMEYGTAEVTVHLEPGERREVKLRPERLYDAAARGWYGGDLHVHLNWMGDAPALPDLAAAHQHGEDLHVLSLVAGNVAGARVYDREAFEHWVGKNLPWSDETHIARFGVEFRNDLLGHVTGFGLEGVPHRYHAGFVDADFPTNAVMLREFHQLGALTGYGHPFHTLIGEEDPPDGVLDAGRNCAAREIVADAALGLIDSLDVVTNSSNAATSLVYRRLLGAGNLLAAVAGTDAVLSISRRGTASSPLGWGRTYARVDGPLSVPAYIEAVRRCRTFATTGPWVELDVDGRGPGERVDVRPGQRVRVAVRTVGPEAELLEIRTADGVVAQGPPGELVAEVEVTESTYVVAVVTGPRHPRSLHQGGVFAHTSPVLLEADGRPVARKADVKWCLDWLNRLERLIGEFGRFEDPSELRPHLELYQQAREVYRSRLGRS